MTLRSRIKARAALRTSVLLAALLLVPACGVPELPQRSAVEVEELLVTTITESADQLTTGEWEQSGGRPRPLTCSEPHTARFSWALKTDPGKDPLSDAKTMLAYWESLGMHTRLVEGKHPAVYARGGDVTNVAFETDTFLYLISGNSLCATGDAADLEERPTPAPTPAS